MKVSSLTNSDERIVSPHDSIASAEEDLLRDGYLVVMDGGVYIGIVLQSDVIALAHELVIDCLTPKPTIDGDAGVEEAARIMMEKHLPVLPALDADGYYLGCVSHDRIFMELSAMRCSPIEMTITNVVGDGSAEASKQDFISQLTHHLRNPLQVIHSSISLIRESSGELETGILLDSIETNVRKIDDVISGLLSEYS